MGRTLVVAAALAAIVGFAAPAHADSQQIKWAVDVQQHGGGSADGLFNGLTGQTLGDAVCSDLKKGTAAANSVTDVSQGGRTTPQSEVIVYWAITDLCPDQMSQRQDHWKDGG